MFLNETKFDVTNAIILCILHYTAKSLWTHDTVYVLPVSDLVPLCCYCILTSTLL